jgi:hypothetical protein
MTIPPSTRHLLSGLVIGVRPADVVHDICVQCERVEWTANAAGALTDLSGGR